MCRLAQVFKQGLPVVNSSALDFNSFCMFLTARLCSIDFSPSSTFPLLMAKLYNGKFFLSQSTVCTVWQSLVFATRMLITPGSTILSGTIPSAHCHVMLTSLMKSPQNYFATWYMYFQLVSSLIRPCWLRIFKIKNIILLPALYRGLNQQIASVWLLQLDL